MRLASRVTWVVTAVTAVTLIISFVTISFLVSRDEVSALDRALFLQAQASASRALHRDERHPRIGEGMADVPEELRSVTRYVAIYDPDGAPVSVSPSFRGTPPLLRELEYNEPLSLAGEAIDLNFSDVHLRGIVLPLGSNGHTMLYAVSRYTVDEDLLFLRQVASVIFVLATLLAAFIARLFSARISREVEAIAEVARAVAQGDLDARAPSNTQGIRETRMLATDLNHMIHQLSALVSSQRTFISHAAHELRSPLSTIRGELQLALRRERSAEEYRHAIEETLTDVDSLSQIAEELLTLARVQSSTLHAKRTEDILVRELVSETLHATRGGAKEREIQILVEEREPEIRIRGARSELIRALRNLIDNAILHSPHAGAIVIEITSTESDVQLSVIDRGPGIPPADRPKIFEPFFRGSKAQGGEHPGTGLGLAIVREIARAHGGEIMLDEAQEAGSRFTLRLPLATLARSPSAISQQEHVHTQETRSRE